MRRHRRSIWTNCGLSLAVCAVCGLCGVAALTALFAAFTFFLMDSMAFSRFFTTLALSGGAFAAGFLCGRFRRRRGLFEGALCGAIMYLAMGAVGVIAGSDFPELKKLLLLACFCAAGGVTGVNSKRPKKLTSD